jgi:hypothetical protein
MARVSSRFVSRSSYCSLRAINSPPEGAKTRFALDGPRPCSTTCSQQHRRCAGRRRKTLLHAAGTRGALRALGSRSRDSPAPAVVGFLRGNCHQQTASQRRAGLGLPVGMCVEVGQSCGQAVGWRWATCKVVHGQSTGCPSGPGEARRRSAQPILHMSTGLCASEAEGRSVVAPRRGLPRQRRDNCAAIV